VIKDYVVVIVFNNKETKNLAADIRRILHVQNL
jgi:hypothetical protein